MHSKSIRIAIVVSILIVASFFFIFFTQAFAQKPHILTDTMPIPLRQERTTYLQTEFSKHLAGDDIPFTAGAAY